MSSYGSHLRSTARNTTIFLNQRQSIAGGKCKKRRKLFGVHIQSDLKWRKHVYEIEKRARGKLYIMLRLLKGHGLPRCDRSSPSYQSFLRSILEYAAPVWHRGLTQNQRHRLERERRNAHSALFMVINILPMTKMENVVHIIHQKNFDLCFPFRKFNSNVACNQRALRSSTKIPENEIQNI